jgi:ATP adenylyltransferase
MDALTQPLLARPFTLSSLPYANHVIRLPQHLSSLSAEEQQQILSDAYLALVDLAIQTIRHDPTYPAGRPSYNVILTLDHLHIVPRRLEHWILEKTGDELSVNSVGFAGMLLVKSEGELDAVISDGPVKILRGVGVESVHDQQVIGMTESQLVL